MAQVLYGLVVDHGDGSAGMRWFTDRAVVDRLLDEENGREEYWGNEGSPSEKLTFPDDLDLKACGFYLSDDDVTEDGLD